jgi:hypothetical protein
MHHSIEIENPSYTYPDGHQALLCLPAHPALREKLRWSGRTGRKVDAISAPERDLVGQGNLQVAGLPVIKEKPGQAARPGRPGLPKPG